MREKILTFFKEIYPESYHIEDVAYILGIKDSEELNSFWQFVTLLTEEGKLMTKDNIFYRLNDNAKIVEGIYKGYRKNFGFVVGPDLQEDIYVDAANKNGAMHNDKVQVRIISEGYGDKKKEGIVVGILERANQEVVGTYDRQKKFGFVIPDDERIGEDIYVKLEDTLEARSGAKVLVKITKWPEDGKRPEGIIKQILGYEGDVGLDINCIMANHKIPFEFPQKVLAASKNISMEVVPDSRRLDLRDIDMVTIDGEDAKDLDDAVSCSVLDNGNFELGVHIADVSHYVWSRSPIDEEAYKRGTSVYLVDRVVPMLPTVLSNGICSLNAHEDRYAMSCIMEINKEGKVINFTIKPSLINVSRRCSYNEVFKALTEDIIPDDLAPLMGLLRNLHGVAKVLNKMRHNRGALDFDFPEYRILIDKEGKPLRIVRKDRTIAERIIEECMLIANETVATFLRDTGNTSVYRIHEVPGEEKISNLQTVCTYLGYPVTFSDEEIHPKDIQKILTKVAGTDIEKIAQIMTLRSMQQAKYSIDNVGHFGLASECYTHFTSPIRRYPDLMVHRLLKKTLHWGEDYAERDGKEEYLARAAEHSSIQEQVAVEAERETDDLKKTEYMLPFLGQVFTGTVNSITSFGMFVELENGIDGLVHINMMDDDFYIYDEEHFLLVGRRTGKTYHLGQEVTVTLAKVDVERRQIDFVLGEVTDIASLVGRLARNSTKTNSQNKASRSKSNGRKNKKNDSKAYFKGKNSRSKVKNKKNDKKSKKNKVKGRKKR